jgi:hypothetical protein
VDFDDTRKWNALADVVLAEQVPARWEQWLTVAKPIDPESPQDALPDDLWQIESSSRPDDGQESRWAQV